MLIMAFLNSWPFLLLKNAKQVLRETLLTTGAHMHSQTKNTAHANLELPHLNTEWGISAGRIGLPPKLMAIAHLISFSFLVSVEKVSKVKSDSTSFTLHH